MQLRMKNQRLRPPRPPGLLQASECPVSLAPLGNRRAMAAESVPNPERRVTAAPQALPVTAVLRALQVMAVPRVLLGPEEMPDQRGRKGR